MIASRLRSLIALSLLLLLPGVARPQSGKKKKPATDIAAPAPSERRAVPKVSGPLRIVDPLIAQMEDSQQVESSAGFVPGETIFFSFQVENYKTGENGRIELASEIQAFDPRGVPIAEKSIEQVKTTVSEEDKNWKPKLRAQILLPSIAPTGSYTIRYTVKDALTSQEAAGARKFNVAGAQVDTAGGLAIRNLGFYRGESDTAPLPAAAYRPGDTLWARFNITGYKYGAENAIDVAYDVAVNNPEGKQIFEQKDAAVEKSKAFYPQPWVPGGINLNLQGTMRPGVYSLVVTARDATGSQTVTEKQDFRVE